MKKSFFIIYFLLSVCFLFAQKPTTPDDDFKKEIVYQNKKYRVYNNWLNAGAGPSYNSNIPHAQFSLVVDYNFHIKKEYFQFGILLSGDDFGNYNNVQAHVCYAKRKETEKYNFAAFLGPSYTSGNMYLDSTYSKKAFKEVGIYAEVQFIGKIKYDLGLGPSLFADYNSKRTIVGIKLDLYFSGAFKGNK